MPLDYLHLGCFSQEDWQRCSHCVPDPSLGVVGLNVTGRCQDVAIETCATHLSNGRFTQQHEFDTATGLRGACACICHGERDAMVQMLLNERLSGSRPRILLGVLNGEAYDVIRYWPKAMRLVGVQAIRNTRVTPVDVLRLATL